MTATLTTGIHAKRRLREAAAPDRAHGRVDHWPSDRRRDARQSQAFRDKRTNARVAEYQTNGRFAVDSAARIRRAASPRAIPT
jgi:hypothetical protein